MIKNKNIDPNAQIAGTKIALASGKTLVGGSDGVAAEQTAASVVTLADGKILVGDSGGNASAVTPTGDVTITNLGVTALGAQKVSGTNIADTAAANVIGGVPVVHIVSMPTHADDDTTVVLTHKTKIIDAWVVKTSAAAANNNTNTVQIKNVATAVTDAVSIRNVADKTITRFTTIDDAQQSIAAGANLVVSRVRTDAGDNNACDLYILCVRTA